MGGARVYQHLNIGGEKSVQGTRSSTIEVLKAHFRYFVSERGGSFPPNRRNVNLDFEKKRLVDSGHGIIRRDAF